jgi:hypothetical protein
MDLRSCGEILHHQLQDVVRILEHVPQGLVNAAEPKTALTG